MKSSFLLNTGEIIKKFIGTNIALFKIKSMEVIMKKKIALMFVILALFSMMFAEKKVKVTVKTKTDQVNKKHRGYMGLYTKSLSLSFARDKNYPYNYGVIISGVVPGSPAEKQGLFRNDIIISIDSLKAIDDQRFAEIVRRHYSGDKSVINLFRNGKMENINFVFGERNNMETQLFVEKNDSSSKKSSRKHRVYIGSGNFYWNPTYVKMKNLTDIDHMVTGLNFNSIDDSGILMNGFTAEGKVGRSIFLGFTGQWYKREGSINVQRTFYDANGSYVANFKRDYTLNINYIGASVVKKIGITRHLVSGFGLDFGGGKSTIMFVEKYHDDNLDNSQLDWTNLNDEYSNAFSYENHLTVEQLNWIVHPKISLEYKILSWLGVKSEIGYLKGYSQNGWETKLNGSKIEIGNNPDSKMDGPTYSIGLTFGG